MKREFVAATIVLALLARPAIAANPDRFSVPRACTEPSPAQPVCVANNSWTSVAAAQHLGDRNVAVFSEGNMLTVIARRSEGPVQLCCSISAPLTRIEGSDLWTLSVNVFALDRAIVDVQVSPPAAADLNATVYYGQSAPRPQMVESLAGRLVEETIASKALNEPRRLTIYLPPGYEAARHYPILYMADGFAVAAYAPAIEAAIVAGEIRPVIVVGLWPGLGVQRHREYLPGFSVPGYFTHANFALNEVLPAVEAKYAPATRPQDRVVAGFSDGAAWALSIGLAHKDLFGGIVAMSLGWPRAAAGIDDPDRPKLFLASGLLEADFNATTQRAFRHAANGHSPVKFVGYTSGHAMVAWQSMLLDGLRWLLPGGKP